MEHRNESQHLNSECNKFFAHTDPQFPEDFEKYEPLFSSPEECIGLLGPEHHCEKCESLDRFHGHLNKVAWWAGKFAQEMFPEDSEEGNAAREWGYLAGLLHDLGKFAPEWQVYLKAAAKGESERGPDHSTAGAFAVHSHGDWFTCHGHQRSAISAILGHHAGLANFSSKGKSGRLTPVKDRLKSGSKKLEDASSGIPTSFSDALFKSRVLHGAVDFDDAETLPKTLMFLTRMLFSALVDADSKVTAALDLGSDSDAKDHYELISQLRERLDTRLKKLCNENQGKNSIADCRSEILNCCQEASVREPEFFTLNVPTGGGKTLSGMSFALNHAEKNGLRRVITVIPYTSIIQQNAQEYRDYLGNDQVIEHHSNLDDFKKIEEGDALAIRHKLSCENWDAPIIVTTTVQFYESLFANKRTRSRKLHNIAQSVIVLDEAHLIPVPFARVILQALRSLVDHFGCSIVLCTATQPALHRRPGLPDGISDPYPIIPPEKLASLHSEFQKRSRIDWSRCDRRYFNAEIGAEIASQHTKAALAIVHLKRDALELYNVLKETVQDAESVFYLTTNLCPKHRVDRLNEISRRIELHRKNPDEVAIYCASTQLVECGCNLDFPFVYRALAGLDSIAQAAGRANRGGYFEKGSVRVFRAETDPFDTHLARCLQITDAMLMHHNGALDIGDPAIFESYFLKLFADSDLDVSGIVEDIKKQNFDTIARKFRIIDSDCQTPIIIPYDDVARERLKEVEWRIESERMIPKALLRSLQPYTVTVYPGEREKLNDALLPLMPDSGGDAQILNWDVFPDTYSEEFGINAYEPPNASVEGLLVS